ncbi:MAG: sigma-70 family RNA polymerase sigma factor, partial [Bacteroidota bacterium]
MQEDNYFIKKILRGEKWAEQALYERHERRWFRLCLRYGKNRAEAMDILQEGLIGVYRDLHQFNAEKGTFVHWSNRVMVNAALRFLKKNQWQQTFVELDEAINEAEISEDVFSKLAAKELIQLINQLPLGYRIVFNMYVIEGFSHQEIADHLNVTASTSKSQLSKAKRALRKK